MDDRGGGKGGLLRQREYMQRCRCARAGGHIEPAVCLERVGLCRAVVADGSRR